jgi:prepilin-type N-terminal cleavage/methylation domain-containing protein
MLSAIRSHRFRCSRRCRQRDASTDAGVSLVELLVVIMILGVLGGSVTTSLVGGMRTSRVLQERTEALSQLELTAGRAARQLRAAAPVLQVAPAPNETVQVRTFSQGTCTRYTYRVQGTRLLQYTETMSPAPAPDGAFPNANACTSPSSTTLPPPSVTPSVLINGLAPGQVFTYRRASDNAIMTAAAAASNPRGIGTITMTLRRQVRDGGTVEVETRILLRNQR